MTDEQIIEALSFSDADEAAKGQLIVTVRNEVSLRVGMVLTETMTEEQHEHFAQLQGAGDDQAVWEWLRDVLGADTSEVYEATLAAYIDEFKAQQLLLDDAF